MPILEIQWPPPGRYILAVSGGADSMVLLDLLASAASKRGYELVVAHFDHGIRADSHLDRKFVEAAAARYGFEFTAGEGRLGSASSEALARTARHAWLEQLCQDRGAAATITAHHQDDFLETSLLNLARGSGRLGLAPMQTIPTILRPLLGVTRAQLRDYAAAHHLTWREDPTNADLTNSRNLLRHRLLPAADQAWRERYLELTSNLIQLNKFIDQSVDAILRKYAFNGYYEFPRAYLAALSAPEREELILAAARALRPGLQLGQALIVQAADFAITGQTGKLRPLRAGLSVQILRGLVRVTTKSAQ